MKQEKERFKSKEHKSTIEKTEMLYWFTTNETKLYIYLMIILPLHLRLDIK